MSKVINNGPYIAGRLAYFRDFRESQKRKWKVHEKIKDALLEGKIIISGLEFKIRTINKQFIIDVSPIKKNDWSRFEEHLNRIKEDEFWGGSYNSQLKISIDNLNFFVTNRREEIKDKKRFVISGLFLNYNNEYSSRYVIDTIVKPLIQYEDFL
jgi:hypothetical protein